MERVWKLGRVRVRVLTQPKISNPRVRVPEPDQKPEPELGFTVGFDPKYNTKQNKKKSGRNLRKKRPNSAYLAAKNIARSPDILNFNYF